MSVPLPPSLRRLRAADSAAVLTAFGSGADMARQGEVSSLADAERYVARLTAAGSPHEAWAVVTGDELVGLVCVTVDQDNESGWFWYWTTRAARGRGWTSSAAATVAHWALTARGLERLELGHRVNNPASGVVARRAGFVKEGTERAKFLVDGQRIDVDTYGRLRSDPAPDFRPLPMADAWPEPGGDDQGAPATDRPSGTRWDARPDHPVPDAVERLLGTVPEWFGQPESNAEYVEAARTKTTWTVRAADGTVMGVALVDRHFPHTAEIHLMVVDRSVHGSGAGSALLAAIEADARAGGVRLLEVKTLGASHPDAGYARTRHFYERHGFLPLEETDLWGAQTPCLIMVKPL